jgi:DNA modification methylase
MGVAVNLNGPSQSMVKAWFWKNHSGAALFVGAALTYRSHDPMDKLHIEYKPIASLKPYIGNPRTHSNGQLQQIAKSITTFGWTNPILIDGDGGVIAGHGRLEAAKLLRLETVPTIRLSDLSEAQKRAYILADNKLAENAGWNNELLAIELQFLVDTDLEFDVTVTGFEMGEIDILLDADNDDDAVPETVPAPDPGPPVSRPGDLWLLGAHRLYCGDALEAASYEAVLAGAKADLIFTDPPYNVPITGHVCGKGAIKHDEFAMASGEMSPAQFEAFLAQVFDRLVAASRDGSVHYICMDWRHMGEIIAAGSDRYAELKNLCVWAKDNGGMGSLYRSQHELVFVFKNGKAPHINNVELGRYGRNRTNVWRYAGVNSFGRERLEDLAAHPTVKPTAMIADAIKDCSNRGDLVLDPFCGSGAILLAAQETGRRAAAIELDPKYVDVAIRRFKEKTGMAATLASTGECFAAIAEARGMQLAEASS